MEPGKGHGDNMAIYAIGDVPSVDFFNAVPRANLDQDNLVPIPIGINEFRWADGLIPDTTGAAGKPKIVGGGYGSGTGIFQGEDAQAALKTETLYFEKRLPESYVAGQTVTVTFTARFNDAGTNTESTKTIDCEAYKIAEAGTAGSDICATAIQTTTAAMAQYTFTITAASLTAGSLLRVFAQMKLQGDSNGALKNELGGASLNIDLKG